MEYTNGLEKIPPHKRVVLKEEMEQHLQTHHNCHFQQAEKTPFAKEPLKSLIEYCADTMFAKELREGTADIENIKTDEYTKDFFHSMKAHPNDPPKAQEELSYLDIQKGFKIWNKKTLTSPLGTYLGLYKAWFQSKKKEDDTEDELTAKGFFEIIAMTVRMAIQLI
eukprot:2575453-Ditylum_brightwellii.AAC.1